MEFLLDFITKMKTGKTKRNPIVFGALVTFALIGVPGCGSPESFEIKDVCGRPEGTDVVVHGFLSLPATIDTIQLRRGGAIAQVGYKMHLTNKPNGSGDLVKVLIWTTNKNEPNKVKAISAGFSKSDLVAYQDGGQEIDRQRTVTVTGETTVDDDSGCYISVRKIEQ